MTVFVFKRLALPKRPLFWDSGCVYLSFWLLAQILGYVNVSCRGGPKQLLKLEQPGNQFFSFPKAL